MSCNWCDINICPNSVLNRQKVDLIIKKCFSGICLDDETAVKKATQQVVNTVKAKWMKPCLACIWVKNYIAQQKKELIKFLNN